MQGWFFSFMLQHYAVSQFYTKSVRNMWSSLKLQEIEIWKINVDNYFLGTISNTLTQILNF